MAQNRYLIRDRKTSKILGHQVKIAKKFLDRLKGLMFTDTINDSDGLLIESCNSIHTCFMRYAIDVVFLDKHNKVVKVLRNVRPWKMTSFYFQAVKVLELKSGTIPQELSKGDVLEVVCIS